MNYSIIIYILGWIMNVEAVCMLVPGITALIYREKSGIAFLITILACLAIGVPLVSRKPTVRNAHRRQLVSAATPSLPSPALYSSAWISKQHSFTTEKNGKTESFLILY